MRARLRKNGLRASLPPRFTLDDPGMVRFGGPGAPEIDLYERDGVVQARYGDGAVVTIAGASHSTLSVVRVLVWL